MSLGEEHNGQSSVNNRVKDYPLATAKYEELVQSSDLFWEKLKAFHQSRGTKFMVPTIGGNALDLHRLFIDVTSRGGIEKLVGDRKWKDVIMVFNFPSTITSASFVVRKHYMTLLFDFEQVYYFHKRAPSHPLPDSGSIDNANDRADRDEESTKLPPGCSVVGTVDFKFDNGYMVTIDLGTEQFKGVLYHVPPVLHVPQSGDARDIIVHRKRKKSRLAMRDPSRPKSNRSGYNFFFAEHYARLKPQYYGQERAISKKIGHLWNNLTDAEKQVYQEKGVQDKERYRNEMLMYRSSNGIQINNTGS